MMLLACVLSCVLLVISISLVLPYALYDRPTRRLLRACKKGKVCYLDNAFPLGLPSKPLVLYEYYHKKHVGPNTAKKIDSIADRIGVGYRVIHRASKLAFAPPENEPVPEVYL